MYDRAAEDYERGRTGWPDAICDGISAKMVLDLAAETGKLTRLLVRHYAKVIAVEPLPVMRSVGERTVPRAEWRDGVAERIPLADASVDAAFVAEAFHWFDSLAAAHELARVVRPGGTVVIAFTDWEAPFDPAIPASAIQLVQEASDRTGSTGMAKWKAGGWMAGLSRRAVRADRASSDPLHPRDRCRRRNRLLPVDEHDRGATAE